MKKQQEIVRLNFRAGEPVLFDMEGMVLPGVVITESNGRPGWYYVRDLDGALHLLMWSELMATLNA